MKLVEEIGIGREAGEVGVDEIERDAPIGDDLVEVHHEVRASS